MSSFFVQVVLWLASIVGHICATKWSAKSGECSTDGTVVYSPLYPQNYAYKGQCIFEATLSGDALIETSFEEYDENARYTYELSDGTPFEGMECVCINKNWSTTLEVTLDANLSIGEIGGDRTDKQPPWEIELDFVCRSPCQDLNSFGDTCVYGCENPWLDRDGLTCEVYESRGYCADGINLYKEPEYFDNFIGAKSANVSALGACCACGGGTGTPVAIAQPCKHDGKIYGCGLPSDTQCARIDLVTRERLLIMPAPAPYVYIFDLSNLPEFGWGVVGALFGISAFGFAGLGCCLKNARDRRRYLSTLLEM